MITDTDREAMRRAIAAGRYAAFCAQITSLNLQPWESTVVYADTPRPMRCCGG